MATDHTATPHTADHSHADHHAPIVPIRTYVTIFLTLGVFTFLTVLAAHQEFGALNTPVALGIAVTKASLVVLFFMGVRYNTPLTKVTVISGFIWLMIMFGLTMNDFLTRAWVGVAGR
jgi:cytochrome c oxidase subunit 4